MSGAALVAAEGLRFCSPLQAPRLRWSAVALASLAQQPVAEALREALVAPQRQRAEEEEAAGLPNRPHPRQPFRSPPSRLF